MTAVSRTLTYHRIFSQVAAEPLLLFLSSLSLFFPVLHSHSITRVTMNIAHAILGQTFWLDYKNNAASFGLCHCAWSVNCEATLCSEPISLIEQAIIHITLLCPTVATLKFVFIPLLFL